jgi:cytochrome c biogenesis protein CcdA
MQNFLSIAFFIGVAALVVVLGLGIANLARTDDKQASRSNQLMRMRVFVQAVVIVILVGLGLAVGAIKLGGG